jgi:hypothetical protein
MRIARFRYGSPVRRPEPSAVVLLAGAFGDERVDLWFLEDGVVIGAQPHRDIEFVVDPSTLPRLLRPSRK